MIRLHHCHEARSERVLWLLNELGLEHEVILHAFGPELREPAYLSKNPIGRVPALEVGDEVMFESLAMIEVLTERHPEKGLGRMPGDPERAEYLVWLHFSETMAVHEQVLTQQYIMLYEDWMRSPTVMKVEAKRLVKCYGALEDHLGDGRDYVLRSGFSAADVALGYSVKTGQRFARLDGFDRVRAWYDRIAARPAFRASQPPEGAALLYKRDFYEVPVG